MFRVPAAVCASRPPTQNTPPMRINTVKMTPRIFATPLAAHYTSLRTELNRLECVSPLYRGGAAGVAGCESAWNLALDRRTPGERDIELKAWGDRPDVRRSRSDVPNG